MSISFNDQVLDSVQSKARWSCSHGNTLICLDVRRIVSFLLIFFPSMGVA